MTTPDKIAKLPKWAQHELARLNADLTSAKNALREHVDYDNPDSDTFLRADPTWDRPDTRAALPLPRGARVYFAMGDLDADRCEVISVWRDPSSNCVHVSATDGSLLARPQSSNNLDILSSAALPAHGLRY